MIEQSTLEEACERLGAAIAANRLVVLCGAGLSMAHPSNLPCAADIAERAREKHIAQRGAAGEEVPHELGEQADYFFDRGQLNTYFIRALIDRHAFAGLPNAGHFSIADLILTRAVVAVVSTNVDGLIEAAGQHLFGEVEIALDGAEASIVAHTVSPLLKIHGCWSKDRDHTIWTSKQLESDPVKGRVNESVQWLQQIVRDKDLLVVGFWSDWAYLNEIIGTALGANLPSEVTIFDLATTDSLATKAPDICALSEQAAVNFKHVQISGASALEALRISFSKAIIRETLRLARHEYQAQCGQPPDDQWMEPPEVGAETLWEIRRDVCGCKPNSPALNSTAEDLGPAVGFTVLKLRAAGATPDGPYWLLDGNAIRVIQTSGDFIHNVKATYGREIAPVRVVDIVICVGAEESNLPGNVARGERQPSVARGGLHGQWLTRSAAFEVLGL